MYFKYLVVAMLLFFFTPPHVFSQSIDLEDVCSIPFGENSLKVQAIFGFPLFNEPGPFRESGDILLGNFKTRADGMFVDCTLFPVHIALDYSQLADVGVEDIQVKVTIGNGTLDEIEEFVLYDLGDFATETIVTTPTTWDGIYTTDVFDIEPLDPLVLASLDDDPFCVDDHNLGYRVLTLYGYPKNGSDLSGFDIEVEVTVGNQTCSNSFINAIDIQLFLEQRFLSVGAETNGVGFLLSSVIEDCIELNEPNLFRCPTEPLFPRHVVCDGILFADKIEYTIDSETLVTMWDENSGIIVPYGKTLIIDGARIEGCREAWAGITVEDGGTLFINNGAIISGAETAVIVEDGGQAIIRNSFLIDNHNGAKAVSANLGGDEPTLVVLGTHIMSANFLLEPYFGERTKNGVRVSRVQSSTGFSNNTFYDLQTGVFLSNSSGTFFGNAFIADGITMPSPGPRSDFSENDMIGIVASGSLNSGPFMLNVGADPVPLNDFGNTFDSLQLGIDIRSSSYVLDARYNTFRGGNLGIRMSRSPSANITNNLFSTNLYGIYSQSGFLPGFGQTIIDNDFFVKEDCRPDVSSFSERGIYLRDLGVVGDPRRIEGNTITLEGGTTGILGIANNESVIFDNIINWADIKEYPYPSRGIDLRFGERPTVERNLVEGLAQPDYEGVDGFVFRLVDQPNILCNAVDNVNDGMRFEGINNNTDLIANDFYDAGTGLRLGDGEVDAIIGQQGSVTENIQNGNEWLGTYSDPGNFGAIHESIQVDIVNASRFIVNSFNDPNLKPVDNQPSNIWFFDLFQSQTLPALTCPGGVTPIPSDLIKSDPYLDTLMAGNDVFPSAWTMAEWIGLTRLKKMDERGFIIPNDFDNYTAWQTHSAQSDLDKYYDYVEASETLASLDSTDHHDWMAFVDSVSILTAELDTIYLKFDTTSADYDSIVLAERQLVIDQIRNVHASHQAQVTSISQKRAADLISLATAINNLPSGTPQFDNFKFLHTYYLDLLDNDLAGIQNDSILIRSIADQCPLMGGEAVLLARGLLAAVDLNVDYDDEINCTLPKLRPGLTSVYGEEATDVSLFPNPTGGRDVQVRFPRNEYHTIDLVNVMGQVLISDRISPELGMYVIPAHQYESLPKGVLIVRLRSKNGSLYTGRLSIQ